MGVLRPSGTFTVRFRLNQEAGFYENFEMDFAQLGKLKLVKPLSALTLEGNTVSYTLTQNETRLFNPSAAAEVQLKAWKNSGNAPISAVFPICVGEVLNDAVLEGGA